MGSIQKDPSGTYHACFRFGGRRFKRSLHTGSEAKALTLLGRIDENLDFVRRGKLTIPPGADIPTFLLTDGRLGTPVVAPDVLTLKELIDRYDAALPPGALEETTLSTIRIHAGHLTKVLGATKDVLTLTREDLQRYINTRAKKKGHRGRGISAITIRKEVTTLSGIWTWAMAGGLVGTFPNKGLKYPKSVEKPPFQTWAEIEKRISRGGLSFEFRAELWDCLFLTLEEIAELLVYVKGAAQEPFLYPMFVLAAHTGARRSEILRSQRIDFDDETVVIHERKRSKARHTTRRVPLSPLLRETLHAWFAVHPGGPTAFVRPPVNGGQPQPIRPPEAHDLFKQTLAGSKWDKLKGWHVLRHSFISNCAMKGVDQRIIDGFVGHTTEEMRRRYTHLFPSSKKAAIEMVFG